MTHSSIDFHLALVLRWLGLVAVLLYLGCFSVKAGVRSHVTVSILSEGRVRVEAVLSAPSRSWSFRNAYAGVLGIAERIGDFRATVTYGNQLGVIKVATGEFRTNSFTNRIDYIVKLSQPRAADVPHVSWLAGDHGFLMLADLIPTDIDSLSVEFRLPYDWTVASAIARGGNGQYQVPEPEKAVFFVGRSLRKTSAPIEGLMLESVLTGTWSFKDSDVLKSASNVMKKYLALTRFNLPGKSLIMIAPLPVSAGNSKWKAETRGPTVVLLIDPQADFKYWKPQLGVIFTHELLHLWVPSSLKLNGDYDWFFEGFTLYTALRTALELKLINFREYLDTLARVYDSYLSYADNRSLLEASERRWTTPGSLVYDKGMLVAFLYDLLIRKASGGKTTLADRYRELFNGAVTDGANANDVIIRLLGSSPASKEFTKSYIESSKEIKLEELLPSYGLQMDSSGKSSQLRIGRELNADQKQLLRSLGYRN